MQTDMEKSGAQLVIDTLLAQGVETVFGYPGGAIMPIYDALYGSALSHILNRNEQGSALAAVGYARASGKVGVCMATSGPGATNLITGLADALLDSIPVVAITGQVAAPLMGTDAFQEVDVLGLSLSVTKHAMLVESVESLVETLNRAFEIAQQGRPGPVLIDIPKDIQQQLIAVTPALPQAQAPVATPPASESLQLAKQLLSEAKRPVLYVGGGVQAAAALPALQQFLQTTAMPSVTTLKGIGSVDPAEPLFLGMLGMHGSRAANLAVQACDLLISAGARFDDRVTGALAEFAPEAKVIHFDIDAAELNKLRRADVGVLGDLSAGLTALSQPLQIDAWQQTCQRNKAYHRIDYRPQTKDIYAPRLLRMLSDRMPEDSVISCDVGQHQMWVAQHMQFCSPHNHLSSGGLGTMGFGLPAAIGAQMARPAAQVINVCGDGSFMMNLQELGTLRRYAMPVKILLLDNQRLGMVRQWQDMFFDGRRSETILSDNPDFVTLASAFEIPGERIDSDAQVVAALERMLAAEGSYLLHVRIDSDINVWPLVPPGAANQNMVENIK